MLNTKMVVCKIVSYCKSITIQGVSRDTPYMVILWFDFAHHFQAAQVLQYELVYKWFLLV